MMIMMIYHLLHVPRAYVLESVDEGRKEGNLAQILPIVMAKPNDFA